jgi:hypothetical protein
MWDLKVILLKSISKSYSPSFHGIHEIVTFKDQRFNFFLIFLIFFIEIFRTPKFRIIRWCFFWGGGSFANHLLVKLSTYDSNLLGLQV